MGRTERRFSLVVALVIVGTVLAGVPGAQGEVPCPGPLEQVLPALPVEGDPLVISACIYLDGIGGATAASINGDQIDLPVSAYINTQFGFFPVIFEWSLPSLPAGTYTLDFNINGFAYPLPSTLTVRPRTGSLGLVDGRFRVTVAAQQPGASPTAVQLSNSGGYYTYFNPADVEITVKMVDGRQVNGHFWVFIASMTDTPFTASIVDTSVPGCLAAASCPTRTYTNPSRRNQNFIDVDAF
jgi:hypothetical protein